MASPSKKTEAKRGARDAKLKKRRQVLLRKNTEKAKK